MFKKTDIGSKKQKTGLKFIIRSYRNWGYFNILYKNQSDN